MRNAFAEELTNLAKENESIFLLSGDIGNKLFDKYKENDASRFLNCGVAEQNMMSMSAGMASVGMKPIVYTITSFLTARCWEQIKVDIGYNKLPVIIVGVGGGLSYAELGPTHHSCEDIGLLKLIPNMTILCPGDAYEVRALLRAALKHDGPIFMRIGKKGEPLVHQSIPEITIGKSLVVKEGNEVCLLSVGNMLPSVMKAAEILNAKRISTQIVSVHTVKPLDRESLQKYFSEFKIVATVEEHNIIGGLGSSIAEWLINTPSSKAKLICMGLPDLFHESLHQESAREKYNLTPESIAERIINFGNN